MSDLSKQRKEVSKLDSLLARLKEINKELLEFDTDVKEAIDEVELYLKIEMKELNKLERRGFLK